jgi:predicted PurR-regulated permease PerM
MADTTVDRAQRTQVELWIGGTAVVVLGLLCLLVLRPFISAALWAVILCFTTWPLFLRLVDLVGGRRTLSALIATSLLAAVIVVPVAILGATLADNVSALISASQKLIQEGPPSPPDWVASVPQIGSHVADYWNYLNKSSSVRLQELARLLPAAKTIVLWGGRALAEGIFQIVLSLLIAFFFYRDGNAAANQLHAALHRIAGEKGDRLLDLAGATIRAVVTAFSELRFFRAWSHRLALLSPGSRALRRWDSSHFCCPWYPEDHLSSRRRLRSGCIDKARPRGRSSSWRGE